MADASTDKYYVPHGSQWPIIGSAALLLTMFGSGMWLNSWPAGKYITFTGLGLLLYMVFGWFGIVIRESVAGMFNKQVDVSFRMGMIWFIASEVMFFAAFFGALFYTRVLVLPWLGGEGNNFWTNILLWTGFETNWPSAGPDNLGGGF
ncbi:MAG: cytochrome c oxidase subunit 3, partial [Pseudomonadota bacterium]